VCSSDLVAMMLRHRELVAERTKLTDD
jgi:hypothetical protein